MALSEPLTGALILIHISAAAIWFGAGVFHLRILQPAVAAAGPASAPVMMNVLRQGGFGRLYGPASITAVAAGLVLYVGNGWHKAAFDNTAAAAITVGALLAIMAFAEGIGRTLPIEVRMKRLADEIGAKQPTPEQMAAMQAMAAQNQRAGRIGVTLIGLAMVAMAGSRLFGAL